MSVVIPCYNSARWIADTLRSVLDQRGLPLQILVVDDGSDDDTIAVVSAFADARISVLQRQHGGVSAARTAGVAAATMPFVAFVDSDDLLVGQTLSARVNAMLADEADVAYCDWSPLVEQPDGAFANTETVSRRLGSSAEADLLRGLWWPPAALMYRRSLTERLVWRDDLPIIQDARYLIDAWLAGGCFVHVPQVGCRYRVTRAPSLSRRDPRGFLLDCVHSAEDLHDQWSRDSCLTGDRREVLAELFSRQARNAFELDRSAHARIVHRLQQLTPGRLPDGSRMFRWLTRLFGYIVAEHIAVRWRRLRKLVRNSRRSTAGAA